MQSNYEETLEELQDIFYFFKGEAMEQISDDELIEFMKRDFDFENKFCSNFRKEDIIEVLKSYCSNYEELLINIFEPVLTNVIGLTLLNKDIYDLEISNIQAKVLLENFRGNNSDDLKAKIEKAVDHICLKLSIKDDFEIKYVKNTALNLVPRIEAAVNNNDLQNIFLSFRSQEEEIMLLKYYLDNKGNDNPSNTGWENKFKELLDKW